MEDLVIAMTCALIVGLIEFEKWSRGAIKYR